MKINEFQEVDGEGKIDAAGALSEKDAGARDRVLEATAMRATLWTVMDYGSAMVLRVVNSLVLTRLLMPEAFGLMTLVTTMVVGISLLADIGLNQSVIRSPRGDEPVFLNTAFSLQIVRALGIFFVALILTWPFSTLYHEPRLRLLIPAIAFNLVVGSFTCTNLFSMSRHMGVRKLFFLDFSTQVVGLFFTVACAWIYPSVWSLVIGSLLSSLYRVTMSHNKKLIPGIHNRLAWDRESVHEIVHFGKWILLSTALCFFASQSDRLILGKLIPLSSLGVYGIAYSVSDIPRAVINAFTQKVGYPFISKMLNRPIEEFCRVFLQYRIKALLAGAILLTLMVHLGGPLVTHMYDHRYAAAGWMVPILALGLWHTLLYSTTMSALLALGKSKYSAVGNAFFCVTVVTGILVGFHFFGLIGAVVAVAAGDFPLYVVATMGASRGGISTWRQDLMATLAFVAMLGIGLGIHKMLFA